MNDEHSNFTFTELTGMNLEAQVVFAVHQNGIFFFLDETQSLYIYETSTNTQTKLPPQDRSIHGHATCLALSPSNKFAAAGFDDGAIQMYDLTIKKTAKVVLKPNPKVIIALAFANDLFIVSADTNGEILAHKISVTMKIMKVVTYQIAEIKNIRRILSLPIYHKSFVFGSQSDITSIAPDFDDCVAIVSSYEFNLLRVNPEFSHQFDYVANNPVVCFDLVSSNELQIAIATTCSLKVFTIKCESSSVKSEIVEDIQLKEQPQFIGFLSHQHLMIITPRYQSLILSLKNHSFIEDHIPITGFFVHGPECIYLFDFNKVYKLELRTYEHYFSAFTKSLDFTSAFDFAKKLASNDQYATLGLPTNLIQRSLILQDSMRILLEQYCINELKNLEKATATATFIVDFCLDMQFPDFISNNALRIFNDRQASEQLFHQILIADPKGVLFNYTSDFINLMISRCDEPKVKSFILAFPSKIISTDTLIGYAQKTNDVNMLSKILTSRCHMPLEAVNILANANDYEAVCSVFLEMISHSSTKLSESLISWLFSIDRKENVRFPYILEILKHQSNSSACLFPIIASFIDKTKKPFKLDYFLNALLLSLSQAEIPYSNTSFKFTMNLFHEHRIPLSTIPTQYLLGYIFSITKDVPDYREDMLKSIIISKVPMKFKEALIPLCDTFGYNRAKRIIQLETKKYEAAIKEMIANPKEDVFAFVSKVLKEDPSSKDAIKKAITTNATYLIVVDCQKFIDLLESEYQDLISSILDYIRDTQTQNYFIYQMKQTKNSSKLDLSKERCIQYCTFLCEYFPDKVIGFLEELQNTMKLSDFYHSCDEFDHFLGCLFIADKLGDLNKFQQYGVKLLDKLFIQFVKEDNPKISHYNKKFEYLLKITKTIGEKKANMCKIYKSFIRTFVLPIYYIEKNKDTANLLQKINFLRDSLLRMSRNAVQFFTHARLIPFFLTTFSQIDYHDIEPTLKSLIYDYNYDIGSNKALVDLFYFDEQKLSTNYIQNGIKGREYLSLHCGTCHTPLLGSNMFVKIFPCGHAFHDNEVCVPKQICPICNPEETLDQDIQRPTVAIQGSRPLRRLKLFEIRLSDERKNNTESQFTEEKGTISIMPRETLPFN